MFYITHTHTNIYGVKLLRKRRGFSGVLKGFFRKFVVFFKFFGGVLRVETLGRWGVETIGSV